MEGRTKIARPTLQKEKWKVREIKGAAQFHRSSKWASKFGPSDFGLSKICVLSTLLDRFVTWPLSLRWESSKTALKIWQVYLL